MKKSTAGIALAATVGFSALSATPAMAVTAAYPNCSTAAAAGVYNIPMGERGYGPHLDSDSDGIGCEAAGVAYVPEARERQMAEPQVETMPEGAPDTGVAQETPSNDAGLLALGGGFVLAVAAGGTYMVRRRNAQG